MYRPIMGENVRLARQVITQCLKVEEGENVWIHTWNHTVDLASKIATICMERGAQPFITLNDEAYWTRSLKEASRDFLGTLPATKAAALEQTDAFVFMLGPRKPVDWNRIPSRNRELATIWYLESSKYLDSWRKIAAKRSVRMLGIEYCIATPERARHLGLNYNEWKKVMLAGCLVDQRQIAEKAAELAKAMRKAEKVSLDTPSGTSLEFALAKREGNRGDSIVSREDAAKGTLKFLPSGFVEVAPEENSANGLVVYDLPVAVGHGKHIEYLKMNLVDGKVVQYSAKKGVEFFENYMNSGHGDVDRFGFFGIGLNPDLRPGFTQDDKVLGGVTVGIGGNEDKGGKNRTVGNRHWWACMSRATVKFDGKNVLKDGRLMA